MYNKPFWNFHQNIIIKKIGLRQQGGSSYYFLYFVCMMVVRIGLLTQIMLEWHQKGVKPLLIIDEGQELAVPMLSELRFVLNYQTDSFSPLTVILVGQLQLTETSVVMPSLQQ